MRQEVPYGLRVSEDCRYLEDNPMEMDGLMTMLEGIVADRRMSAIAEDLNTKGHLTREGEPWNQVSVFHMLPRLIELSPRLFADESWVGRRNRLKAAGGADH